MGRCHCIWFISTYLFIALLFRILKFMMKSGSKMNSISLELLEDPLVYSLDFHTQDLVQWYWITLWGTVQCDCQDLLHPLRSDGCKQNQNKIGIFYCQAGAESIIDLHLYLARQCTVLFTSSFAVFCTLICKFFWELN